VEVRGRKPDNVTAKDFMLEILRHPTSKAARRSAAGGVLWDAVASLSVDERAHHDQHTAEVGGFTGYVAPDAKTVDYLVAYREDVAHTGGAAMRGLSSDAGAEYCEVIEIGRLRHPADDRAAGRSGERSLHRRRR